MKAVCRVYPGDYSLVWAIQVCSARKAVWFLAILNMAMSQIGFGFCTLGLVSFALTSTIKLEDNYGTLCAFCIL